MLVITGKAAEMVEKYEKDKKAFVGDVKLPTLTDEQLFTAYKVLDMMKTFPLLIDIFHAVGATAAFKTLLGKEELLQYILKLRELSIEELSKDRPILNNEKSFH
jgi:hypothetical protein